MTLPRIYVDFGNADSSGRIRLITNGSLEDIDKQCIQLCEGLRITVYDSDLLTDAKVVFSAEEHIWVAQIDWEKLKKGDEPTRQP